MFRRRRCYRCRRRLRDEYTTVVISPTEILDLCDGCSCLYTNGRIEVAGIRCPDAEPPINSPALAARRWTELGQ